MMNRYSLSNLLGRDRKMLYTVLSILIVSVLTLTVVYAALSTTLNINGNAEVTAANWDVYLDNAQLNSQSATQVVPTISNKTTASFSTTLSKPGDFYEFTIDVVNNGSIDAMIDSVTKTPTLTTTQAKYLNYIVEYQNGEAITTKQLVNKNSFVRLKVKVEFRKDITASDLPTSSETLNLSFTVNYAQADATGTNVTDNGVKKLATANGSLDDVGTIVTIGDQQFYTIGTEGDNVKLLAMHNLYVGGTYNSGWIAYGEEATGKQDPNMRGYVSGQTERKGTTAFSSSEQKGENYSSYEGSIVEGYVNDYKTIIESEYGVEVVEARLITKYELENEKIGCSSADYTCEGAPEWIYSTSYWSASATDTSSVWRVYSDADFSCNNYNNDINFGVRPVIIISKSNF